MTKSKQENRRHHSFSSVFLATETVKWVTFVYASRERKGAHGKVRCHHLHLLLRPFYDLTSCTSSGTDGGLWSLLLDFRSSLATVRGRMRLYRMEIGDVPLLPLAEDASPSFPTVATCPLLLSPSSHRCFAGDTFKLH